MQALSTDEPLRRWRNALACLGLGAIAAFVLALFVLHLAAGRQPPSHMSEFANSRFGLLWALAVYTFILGAAMVVWALRPSLRDCPSKWIGIAMLWLAGLAAVLLAAFPTDDTYVRTFSGRVHNDAAVGTFVLMGTAMVVLAPAFRASPGLDGFARVSVLLGVLVTASWVTYLVTTLKQIEVYGPAQRVLVGGITAWFVLLALHLRKASASRPADRPRLRTIVLEAAQATPATVRRRKPAPRVARARPSAKRAAKAAAASQPRSPARRAVRVEA